MRILRRRIPTSLDCAHLESLDYACVAQSGPSSAKCLSLKMPPSASNLEPTHPAAAYLSRPKATASQTGLHDLARVRHNTIDTGGRISLRHAGHMHHIGLSRTRVIVLIDGLDIRVIDRNTGELIRELTLGRASYPRNPKNP